jgi:phage replication initiation protein
MQICNIAKMTARPLYTAQAGRSQGEGFPDVSRKQKPLEVAEIDAIHARATRPIKEVVAACCGGGERSEAGRGRTPPPNNMGGKVVEAVPVPVPGPVLRLEDGRIVEVTQRRGYGGDAAFVDWVNVTCNENEFFWGSKGVPVSDDQVIAEVSSVCRQLFGFGITAKRERGANFYTWSYELGDGWGMVCYGGQRNTVLIMLSGEGCTAARHGWELRLRDWLAGTVTGKITRVDLAYDDYSGEKYSVDAALADYRIENFMTWGREPDCEQRGNWQKPNGKGRTFNVGHRTNGKFARIYEKGRQLGDKSSEWVRIEGELKAVDRIIPFDVLTDAGAYLAAMYPAFGWIKEVQTRIITTQKAATIKYSACLDWLKKQCGASLWFCAEVEGGIENLFQKIKQERAPKRLVVPDFQFSPAAI